MFTHFKCTVFYSLDSSLNRTKCHPFVIAVSSYFSCILCVFVLGWWWRNVSTHRTVTNKQYWSACLYIIVLVPSLKTCISSIGVPAIFNRLLIKVLLYNVYALPWSFSLARIIACNDISEINACNRIIRTCVGFFFPSWKKKKSLWKCKSYKTEEVARVLWASYIQNYFSQTSELCSKVPLYMFVYLFRYLICTPSCQKSKTCFKAAETKIKTTGNTNQTHTLPPEDWEPFGDRGA